MLKLSDLYTVPEDAPSLELEAVMLNINPGHNPELLDACQALKDYSEYTERVRKYADEMPLAAAVEQAITEYIREGILKEFLSLHRAEVKNVSIYEYDAEKHMRQEREAEYERGMADYLLKLIQKKLELGDSIPKIADDLLETEETIQELIKEYLITGH